jgi:hypothetical protein
MSEGNHIDAVRITFFPDFAAATKREEAVCLRDLADRIAATSAASKGELPWLKLATFGDLRSDKNSLRCNANVLTISGVEADYDQERVSFNDAVAILAEAGVKAIVYTSPSHTAATPRWRALCPLSKPIPPEQRDRYMARLNGVFSGIIAPESWTLSQSYYFGSVDHNQDHRVEQIEGTPIDLLDELDARAIGKPENSGGGKANERPISSGAAYVPASDARLEAFRLSVLDTMTGQATDGQKHRVLLASARTLGGVQHAAGFTDAQAVQWLMDALPASVVDWNAAKETAAWGLAKGREKPLQLDNRPYRGNGTHAPPEPPPADDAPPWRDDQEDEPQAETKPPHGDEATDSPELRALLSIEAWAVRDIPDIMEQPPPDQHIIQRIQWLAARSSLTDRRRP